MRDAQARTVYLKDYRPPAFLVDETDLRFDLYEDHARVRSTLLMRPNEDYVGERDSLVLQGQSLSLESLSLDGKELTREQYLQDNETLTITGLNKLLGARGASFTLSCQTRIEPQNNTALEGLYKSGDMFCTQCEAEGFRRMTYYPDRPDVMSIFTTTISAERARYPVLLSNGNPIESGVDEANPGRHWKRWHDPYRKPCYLFALVAGDLECIEDSFTTCSGREVALRIFVEEKDVDKCGHAMQSLKQAMRWDEETYGREYDLDIFMIVAVDAFNMGAMENKGLNIFNTSCVLANPLTTTDLAFQRVEGVVAHEYFHNWSGNRVTCRDWFQLSLKEGFTVFRDSEFSADMGSRTVKRIEDVTLLRTAQFAEDAGPMSHPVRPDSYMEISNFYTLTIYEKGAEVVRMISQILGPENFRKGTDLYFERHDGQAVTTEDFVKAMEESSGIDLTQFRRWYSQSGTPVVLVESDYDEQTESYTLMMKQSCPPTPGQSDKAPFHIPVRLGLLDSDGNELPLRLEGQAETATTDRVVDLLEAEQSFRFVGVTSRPVPSLLRGFSAPVRLSYTYGDDELVFLMVHDTDGFNRWNASQQLAVNIIHRLIDDRSSGNSLVLPEILAKAYSGVIDGCIANPDQDLAMIAQLLTLPSESYLIEIADCADVAAIHEVRDFLAATLASRFADRFEGLYRLADVGGDFSVDAEAVARRALKNTALSYLVRTGQPASLGRCRAQYDSADNMTDSHAALRLLVHADETADGDRMTVLTDFYNRWRDEPLVMDQWFMIQATDPRAGALSRVKALAGHEKFNLKNPNKVRSLISAFCTNNHIHFHREDGDGYEFLADQVLALDRINPQIAARLLTPLTRWRKFDSKRQASMQAQLLRIKATDSLSRDVFEIVEKSTMGV